MLIVNNNNNCSEAEFKEFETRLKYVWFHLKLYSMFQDFQLKLIFGGFEKRLKFIKFGLNKKVPTKFIYLKSVSRKNLKET